MIKHVPFGSPWSRADYGIAPYLHLSVFGHRKCLQLACQIELHLIAVVAIAIWLRSKDFPGIFNDAIRYDGQSVAQFRHALGHIARKRSDAFDDADRCLFKRIDKRVHLIEGTEKKRKE